MAKKKRPNSTVAPANKNAPAAPQPVMPGDVFAHFIREAQSIGNEVMSRRQVHADVAEFLAMKNLAEEFETWRKAKYTPTPLT